MNNYQDSFNFNEKVIFALRALYSARGYTPYKMSKFEEYDLYARNKDFLISDSVITFTDTNGKLMALKPDVTLSIIKNINIEPDCIQKVFYNENVYRVSKGSHAYKEIMQAGLECFGDIDDYSICEVITLAAKSLKTVSDKGVLDISHLGLLQSVIKDFNIPENLFGDILRLAGEKNAHELVALLDSNNVPTESRDILKLLVSTVGNPLTVLPRLEAVLDGKADTATIKQLLRICNALDDDIKEMIRIDFSVVNDIKYYNGIVFKGFIEGIPTSILSGGQYDKLMQKMKRKSGAIGFAVYLDMLERFNKTAAEYDVDILLTYSDDTDLVALNKYAEELINSGKRVLVSREIPQNIKYEKQICCTKKG